MGGGRGGEGGGGGSGCCEQKSGIVALEGHDLGMLPNVSHTSIRHTKLPSAYWHMWGLVGGHSAGPPFSQLQQLGPASSVLQRVPSAHCISYGTPESPSCHGHCVAPTGPSKSNSGARPA